MSACRPRERRGPLAGVPVIATAPDYDARPPVERRLTHAVARSFKPSAQRALRLVLGIAGYLTRERGQPLPPLRAGDERIQRILVVRVDLLGDTVLSLPAVRVLARAYPHAAIDLLVQPSSAALVAAQPGVRRVIAYNPHVWRTPRAWLRPRTWREGRAQFRVLRAERYDLAISISGDIGSIVTRLSGARRRVGFAGEAYPYFLTDGVAGARYTAQRHEVEYVLALARAAGGSVLAADRQPRLCVSPVARAEVAALLRAARGRIAASGPVVTLHAGARNGQAKRWPSAHFAALADRLVRELDALVVLTGAPADEQLAAAVASRARVRVCNLAGQTSLPQLAALLAASDVVVSGDSGPMHIACAVGTPVVALHGPTDPQLSGPIMPGAVVLRLRLWCSPCYDASATAECRFHNPVCMKDLAPSIVFGAVRRLLAQRVSRTGASESEDWHAATASP